MVSKFSDYMPLATKKRAARAGVWQRNGNELFLGELERLHVSLKIIDNIERLKRFSDVRRPFLQKFVGHFS